MNQTSQVWRQALHLELEGQVPWQVQDPLESFNNYPQEILHKEIVSRHLVRRSLYI